MQTAAPSRLAEPPIDEIKRLIYRPSIERLDDAAFAAMCAMNQAHLVMLARCRILSGETAATLGQAMRTMVTEGRAALPDDPAIEDPYFAFEARLTEIVGPEAAGRLHAGRSRNDIGATLDRMAARRYGLAVSQMLADLRTTVLSIAARHTRTVVPGHTHLQPAQPITFGFYMVSFAAALERDADRILAALSRIDACPLGCAAMAGTSFPLDRALAASLLGFSRVAEPGLDAVASRDVVTELLWAVTTLSVTYSRVLQDFYVFFTHEFAAIDLPDRIAGTSSIMPQKKNPIALEFLRAEAARAIGGLTSTLASIKSTNFSIALDAQREGLIDLWAVLDRAPGNLRLFTRIVESVTLRTDTLLERCRTNFSTATDLADGLVQRCDLPFREAHHIVGGVVRLALAQGLTADRITVAMVEQVAAPMLGRELGIDDAFLQACLSPAQAVEARNSQGGTAASEVERMIADHRTTLERDVTKLAARRDALARSVDDLADALAELTDTGAARC